MSIPTGEFDIISRYFTGRSKTHPLTRVGVGDDCAVFDVPLGQSMAVSLDTLVAGRHFPFDASASDIATRAFCVCLSDLAAMGAKPQCFTLALTLPEAHSAWLQAFSDSLFAIADQYQCELIGGDTTQGPLTISLQVHGTVHPNEMLRRNAAKVGDTLYVTNTLGDGAAALSMFLGKQVLANHEAYLKQRFYCPKPQVEAGLLLNGIAHAAIDISDGLLADVQHVASASNVDVIIDIEQLPLSEACKTVDSTLGFEWALTGGDDYQLAFTVPVYNQPELDTLIESGKLNATAIGCVTEIQDNQPMVHCRLQQKPWQAPWQKQGFDHFAP